ncbi:uncharacterized protein LOC134681123 [Mytilus trossulus]|uniref:uncharacterized protein LOC134681123 n=1 Tax=Mytilus trossulus TaxID=6551 RepID=UPI0030057DD7
MATADAQQHKPSSRRSSRRNQPSPPDNEFIPNNMTDTAVTTVDGHRPHHHHHRTHSNAEKSKTKSRPTKQLDFDQAMADFKTMFPTMDCEIIEAVLRANDGAVDSTIDQLLTMSIDTEGRESPIEIPPDLISAVEDDCPLYNEHRSEDSPPSYTEAVSTNIWTTPISSQESKNTSKTRSHSMSSKAHKKSHRSQRSKSLFDPETDELSLSNTEPKRPPSSTMTHNTPVKTGHNTPVKTGFRNWNPPMLGNLPDDFLRLIPPSETTRSFLDTNIDLNEKPRVHHRRSKHVSSRSSSERKKLSQSVLTEDNSTRQTKLSRSMSERSPIEPLLRTRGAGMPLTNQSLIISSHEFTQGMLDKKMKENERRRRTAVMNADPEMSQYLEDERLAIMLQNSEFLQELRGNEEFMQTLEKERIRNQSKSERKKKSPSRESTESRKHAPLTEQLEVWKKSHEVPEVPRLLPIPQQEDRHDWSAEVPLAAAADVRLSFNDDDRVSIEGYGDDRQQQLDAFPFSQPIPQGDDDAELRHKLKDMGGASRKQFMALARKFFSRKKTNKRTLKQIQKEKLAPSMMNLLNSDEEEFNGEEHFNNSKPYDQEPEIEPLPTSLISVPGHKYVQRPHYHPDTITTYHDNMGSDMV